MTVPDELGILIVDDHEVFRLGLRLSLEGTGLGVVGEASSGAEAIEIASRIRPDVVLLDLGLPDRDGFGVCTELRSLLPDVVVVVLSSYDDASSIRSSRLAGARGHLSKEVATTTLIDVVRLLVRQPSSTHFPNPSRLGLTDREMDVLEGLALGLSQPVIASRLGIGHETVKTYVRSVYEKLGATDRAEALEIARTKHLIGGPPSRGYHE